MEAALPGTTPKSAFWPTTLRLARTHHWTTNAVTTGFRVSSLLAPAVLCWNSKLSSRKTLQGK